MNVVSGRRWLCEWVRIRGRLRRTFEFFSAACLLIVFLICPVYADHTHTWQVTFTKYSSIGAAGHAVLTCRSCGTKLEKELDPLKSLGTIFAVNRTTLKQSTVSMSKAAGILCQGRAAVRISMPCSGELMISTSGRQNIKEIRLHKASTFKDPGTVIPDSGTKSITLNQGIYYLEIIRTKASSTSTVYNAAAVTFKTKALRKNNITCSDRKKVYSENSVSFSLNAVQNGDAVLVYESSDSAVKISTNGKVSLPAGYLGNFQVKITAPKTALYTGAEKTVNISIKPPSTEISSINTVIGNKLQLKWKESPVVSGYLIQYSTDPTFASSLKTKTISSHSTTMWTSGILAKNSVYYVRIRTYSMSGADKIYSPWSQTKKRTIGVRILMLGNSLTLYGDLSSKIAELSGASVTVNAEYGAWLYEQLSSNYDLGMALSSYLKNEKWDYVIIQEYSRGPIVNAERFQSNVKELCSLIRKNGAEPILYATWAYYPGYSWYETSGYTELMMFQQLYRAYHQAGALNQAVVADVGLAFYTSDHKKDLYHSDLKHDSEQGAMLAARVIYATLLGES